MDVTITSTVLAGIRAAAAVDPAREICGLLFGTRDRVDAHAACANVAVDPARTFEIDPAALLAAYRAARNGGPQVVGHYHSHPSGVAVPSARDADAAMGDGALWLIVAGDDVRVWRAVRVGGFAEVAFAPLASRESDGQIGTEDEGNDT